MPSFILGLGAKINYSLKCLFLKLGILPPIGPNLLCDRDEKELPSRLPV